MMQWCKQQYPDIPLSVEIEKPCEAISSLFSFADIIFFSQSYAHSLNYTSAHDLCQSIGKQYPEKIISCAWGKDGAGASLQEQ